MAIPSSVTTIEGYTFCGCTSLVNIAIPSSVTTIEDYTFSGCRSLVNIVIPSSVTTICYRAFSDCTSLVNIAIPSSVTTIGFSAFEGCTSLVKMVIPSSVTTIGESAFERCIAIYVLSRAANKSVEEFLRDRYSRYSQRKAVLLSINKVTELRSQEPPRRRRRLEHANVATVREELNGLLAYDMITAEELWREILMFV